MAEFIVLSAPIRSGKTTKLMKTFSIYADVSGFLTPDIANKRVIYDLQTREYYDFESHLVETNEPIITVGKFCFFKSGFEKCRKIMSEFLVHPKSVFIIDEVGKLEMNGLGHEPYLSTFLQNSRRLDQNHKIIIVVRDTLLLEFRKKYGFLKPTIVSNDYKFCINDL